MQEPSWVGIARRHLGVTEIPGKATHPAIRRWLLDLRAWWADDETPWCGTFVAAVLREAGHALPQHWYRARAWATWGTALAGPALGAVVVYERKGGGHVGFVVGTDERGRIVTLGGNQGNSISVAPFERDRVLAFRWPPFLPPPASHTLPLIETGARSSREEA